MTEEIVKEIESLKNDLSQYLSYDFEVGGIVSSSIRNLEDAQRILKEATLGSIQEALVKVQAARNACYPYGSYAPEIMRHLDSLLEKISKLHLLL